jgi:hypothetical protein
LIVGIGGKIAKVIAGSNADNHFRYLAGIFCAKKNI